MGVGEVHRFHTNFSLTNSFVNIFPPPALRYGEGHECGGGFEVAFAAVDNARVAERVALRVNGGGSALLDLADVEQQFALLREVSDGADEAFVCGCVAVSVALQDKGLGRKLSESVRKFLDGKAGDKRADGDFACGSG